MRNIKEFDIEFSGLKTGLYDFDFEVDTSFFDFFKNEDAQDGSLKVHVDMDRQERMLVLDFHIFGTVKVICDRCLDLFDFPVESMQQIIAKFGDEDAEEDENLIVISEKQHKINVAQFIYEFIILALPIQKIHPDDENGNPTCDPSMLKKLEELQNQGGTDSRWDALKKLKDKD